MIRKTILESELMSVLTAAKLVCILHHIIIRHKPRTLGAETKNLEYHLSGEGPLTGEPFLQFHLLDHSGSFEFFSS